MRSLSRSFIGIATLALGAGAFANAENLEGRWSATLVQGGTTIPFRLDISGDGDKAVGTLYNGEDKEFTTSASIKNGKVELNFEHYLTSIVATVKDGELDGTIEVTRRGASRAGGALEENGARRNGGSPFHATRYVAASAA